jgi:deoxyribodipyrimidine photolyase-related protein
LKNKTLRLILGDQLNSQHSWFEKVDDSITYVLMEVRSETDYANHHIQKVVGFFVAMQCFAYELIAKGHQVIYIKINDVNNQHSFDKNLGFLIQDQQFTNFEYQNPDEYRLDELMKAFCESLAITQCKVDSEHFLSTRDELGNFFSGKKMYLMESFYRMMRKKHNILMDGKEPTTGQWNYDADNRKKLPANHKPVSPLVFDNM